jgi:site-specific DNA-cytosine methylase
MGTGGNNVPVVVEGVDVYNQSLTGEKSKTLVRGAADADHIPCVVMDRSAYNQGVNAKYNIGIDENGVAFSHIAKGPGAVCYCLQGNQVDCADSSVCNGSGFKEDTSYTLNVRDRHCVAYKNPRYIVRRLTPLECERLQGFPDGWTDIGEYIDAKGKKKKSSDSARYKALGNSIALPPWKWVVKRISAQYERDATMASLFDGIGGFPYLWEQINGKGTALWASEIEDFPIAVTKTRIE